jgi:acyl transferase domain-containing protein
MGLQLAATEPLFRSALDECTSLLKEHDIDLLDLLAGASGALDSTAAAQPAIFSLEWSLASMWIERGAEPDVVLGHSLGEIVAAAVAGVMSLPDAIHMVTVRGRAMAKSDRGAMTVVRAPEAALGAYLDSGCVIASVNSETSCTVSGPVPAIEALEKRFAANGNSYRRLNVSHAFHSALMLPVLPELREAFGSVHFRKPERTLISCVTGNALRDDEAVSPDFWVNHSFQPVRFLQALRRIGKDKAPVWLEIGPTRMLAGVIEGVFGSGTRAYSSLESGSDERDAVAATMQALAGLGVLAQEWS